MSVLIRILETKSTLQKMVDAFIARGIAEAMQGKTFRATLNPSGSADIDPGQDFPTYWLPEGSFSVVSNKIKRASKI